MTKGKNNYMWKGGIFEYPNHYLMKKQRLIVLTKYPRCMKCEKKAIEIHHKNENKANHHLSNLMAVCRNCHIKLHSKHYNGKTINELCKEYKLSRTIISRRLKHNIPLDAPRTHSSKYRKLYGRTLEEIAKQYNTSIANVCILIKMGKGGTL